MGLCKSNRERCPLCKLPEGVPKWTVNNIKEYWEFADAFIIGSHFKEEGKWQNEVDYKQVSNFMKRVAELRLS